MTAPRSMVMAVCTTCRLPWESHVRTATRRWHELRGDDNEVAIPLPGDIEVTHLDCVLALQDADRGPMGPPGPAGPQGVAS